MQASRLIVSTSVCLVCITIFRTREQLMQHRIKTFPCGASAPPFSCQYNRQQTARQRWRILVAESVQAPRFLIDETV